VSDSEPNNLEWTHVPGYAFGEKVFAAQVTGGCLVAFIRSDRIEVRDRSGRENSVTALTFVPGVTPATLVPPR